MLIGRRYLLALTEKQREFAETIGATCRVVWHTGLEQRREYTQRGSQISYDEQVRQLAEAKRDDELSWLAAPPSHALQETLRDLDRACRAHGAFGVRWRPKRVRQVSFRFPDPRAMVVRRLNRRWGQVVLPKLGAVWTRSREPTEIDASRDRRLGAQSWKRVGLSL